MSKVIKTIKYYRINQWGNNREFIHSNNIGDAQIIEKLIGKKSIDSATRELIRDLSGGTIAFEEVIAPSLIY